MGQESILITIASVWAGLLGVGVLFKSPRQPATWLFAGGIWLLAAVEGVAVAASETPDLESLQRWESVRLLLLSALPSAWLAFSLCYSRGNYREFLKKWRLVLIGAALLPLLPALSFTHLVGVDRTVFDLGVRPLVELRWPARIVHLALLVSAVLVLMNFERTFRAAVGTLRWRIKFALLGFGLLFAALLFTSSQALLYSASEPGWETLNAGALLLACVLITISFFRTSLSGVEVYPSSAVLQNSLTVLLAGAYLLVVGVLAKVVVFLGGDASFPIKAFLVLVTVGVLGVLLASDRVRLFLRRFTSRHFHRPFYDYRALWRQFTERTSSIVEEAAYARELANLVSDAVQSLSVSVWLVPEGERRGKLLLTASTAVAETPASPSAAAELDLRGFEDQLAHDPEPVELDESREEWVAELKRRHEAQLNAGGSRVAVPLVGKEQLLGLLLVGYRVSGLPFSVEDFELFKCLAAQAAGGLLNLRLSQQLARSRQMEAFQSMAAFFVHDLKNTASSLSLMLQNLPTQMENPAFRQDALRAVSKAVGRLNELIARLGLLREKVRMSPVEADLNQVVQIALEAVAVAPEVSVVRSLSDGLPRMSLDPDQVQKVVTNLLINARDAVGRGGEIRVGTTAQGGWAVLSVADNGCGMSVDFLARSLFRPFQTTKKTGIGIGMFHCKTIVEAHRGRIEVESQIGKGTTFRVWLPVMGGKS